ncbi:MAG: hypothetical protein PUP93_18035 [Rhizonema sp. NSF051]|nr:hypothetical protein [Rhizonema sp. NSF051]
MTKTRVHLVVNINQFTIIVFYTPAHCWQFQIIKSGEVVFAERKIYYTPEAAEVAGRNWILNAS